MNTTNQNRQLRCAVTAVLLTFGALLLAGVSRADDGEARRLVKAMFDQTKVSFSAHLRLSAQGGLTHVLEVRHTQNDNGSSTYMEITAPYIVKGTRFLSFDRDQGEDEHYTFVPVVRRSVRVPQWTLEHSFLGSTFYMIDINIPDLNEFRYDRKGSATIHGRACEKVEAVPTKAGYPYGKIDYCVAPDINVSLRTEYFDTAGALLKVWQAQRLEDVDGVWTPLDQTMENVQTQSTSRLEILDIKQHVQNPPETFTKSYLER